MKIATQFTLASCLLFLASCDQKEPSSRSDGAGETHVAHGDSDQNQDSSTGKHPQHDGHGNNHQKNQPQDSHGQPRHGEHQQPAHPNDEQNPAKHSGTPLTTGDQSALNIFEQRILPIFNAKNPSSCTECHLSSVDLKDYIHPSQEKTFASLVNAGLVNTEKPDDSKILAFISRRPEKPNLITDKVRKQEYEAFRAWIQAAVKEPGLLAAKSSEKLGPSVPDEVIRHARKDRVLASFIDNIWSEVGRCSGCHSPDQNQKQVKEHGEQVSWIKLRDPLATMEYMIEADLIDAETPEDSLLLLKPTMQVDHGGGQKMVIGDRSYRQFRRFIDDYAAMVAERYKSPDDLPEQSVEVSFATSMSNGIWLKVTGVPARYDKKLLQADVYRRDGEGWSEARWATADRAIAGDKQLWQQTLTLTAPRESERAGEIRRDTNLPPGEYLVKIYIDDKGRLEKDSKTGLGQEEFVGQVVVNSQWPRGYGKMTVVLFPKR